MKNKCPSRKSYHFKGKEKGFYVQKIVVDDEIRPKINGCKEHKNMASLNKVNIFVEGGRDKLNVFSKGGECTIGI